METSEKKRIDAAKKYADEYDGMQWEKDRVEIAFIKGYVEGEKARYQEFCKLQEQLAIQVNTTLAWERECIAKHNQVEELKEQVDLQHEMARADQAKLAEKDKEIASLKETLRKAKYFIDYPEDTPSNREIKKFILEIENLLK